MMKANLGKLVSLGMLLCAAGCSSANSTTTRGLSGRVSAPEGVSVSAVMALSTGASAKTYSAPVDASGAFRLDLTKGKSYVLQLMSGDTAVGTVHFAASSGGARTSLLTMTSAPGTAEADDDKEADVDLGDVKSVADKDYEPTKDPLDQVDTDDDGKSDFADADDDDDGVDDEADTDDNDDGVEDSAEVESAEVESGGSSGSDDSSEGGA